MSSTAGGNLYEYPNGVLRNKLGITDAALLQQVETTYAAMRQAELASHPVVGHFDLDYLRAIHRHLFQDIYTWAGDLRQVDITKGNSTFAHYRYVATNAQALFARLSQERFLVGLTQQTFAQRAAYFLGEVNVLHPFREGNGRTQRIFFSALAAQAGYSLEWARISPQQMTDASILSLMRGDNSGFEQIFAAILTPIQP